MPSYLLFITRHLLPLLLLLLPAPPLLALELSAEESAFLEQHRVLRVHNEMDWPPYNSHINGQPQGFSIDYFNLLAAKLNVEVEYVSGYSWAEFLGQIERKELDLMLNIAKTAERSRYIGFTEPYSRNPKVIIVREGEYYPDLNALAGRKVASPQGFFFSELIAERFPAIKQVLVKDTFASLKAVLLGQADAAVGSLAAINHQIRTQMLTGLTMVAEADMGDESQNNLHIGVRNDWPLMVSILNKAIASVSQSELLPLQDRWLGSGVKSPSALSLKLSYEESHYLKQHPQLRYCVDPESLPFEIIIDAKLQQGVINELMTELGARLNLTTEAVITTSLSDSLKAMRDNRCDLLPATPYEQIEGEGWLMSEPYFSYPLVLVTRNDFLALDQLNRLSGESIGLLQDHSATALLTTRYPTIDWQPVTSIEQGLEQLRRGELTGIVEQLAVIGQQIHKQQIIDLKVAYQLPHRIGFRLIVPERSPLLFSAFSKALQSLSESDLERIVSRWQMVSYTEGIDLGLVLRIVAGLFIVMGLLWFHNRDLKKYNQKIARAHVELQRAKAETEQALEQVARLLNHSGEGFLSIDSSLKVKGAYSRECLLLFGKNIDNAPISELLYPEDSHRAEVTARNLAMIFESDDEFQQEMLLGLLPRELELTDYSVRIRYQRLDNNEMMLVISDISAEKALQQQIATEQQRLRFIVSVILNRQEFFDLIEECRHFLPQALTELAQPEPALTLDTLFRQIHTFKGLTNQLDFLKLPQQLHRLEDQLGRCRYQATVDLADLAALLQRYDYLPALEHDIALIRAALGDEFFASQQQLSLSQEEYRQLQQLSQALHSGDISLDNPIIVQALTTIEQLQLVDFASLLKGFPAHCEELALQQEKLIEPFTIEGETIKVSRQRFAPLARASIHLFRNAIAHGIETPEERLEAGKAEAGRLRCTLQQRDKRLWLEVSDDGKGLDTERIIELALARGVVSHDQAERLDNEAIGMLIFHDGFSTREAADSLAGRGEGLAAVKAECDALGGEIAIDSRLGLGTRFTLKVPLSP
ncbi:hypothetical protein D5085_02945 [Ectothiorhodospiraceae bacterium BW-2]|nr:hypothetical protein D5085_02945 [Ectothiorhodospiraceae bacterium BW-2]